MSPSGRQRVLALVAMNHSVNDSSVYLISSLFPVVLAVFGLSIIQVGVLVGAGYLVSVVGQPLAGRYSEGADPRLFLAAGIGIISVSALTFVFSTGFYSILGSVVLLRIGASFFHPVGMSAVSRTHAGKGLDRAMGILSGFGNLGIFLVFLSSASLYFVLGWRGTFLLFAGLTAADVVLTLALLKVPRYPSPPRQATGPPEEGIGLRRVPVFFMVSAFIIGGCNAILLNYTNILLEAQSHLGVLLANLAVAGFVGLGFLGAVSSGRWAGAMRRASALGLVYLLSSALVIVLALAPGLLVVALPALLASGFVMSAIYPLMYSELTDFMARSPGTSGRAFGALFSAQTIGGSVFGLVSGYISSALGLPSAYLLAGFFLAVGAAAAALWRGAAKH